MSQERARAMYAQGMRASTIAQQIGVSTTTVYRWLGAVRQAGSGRPRALSAAQEKAVLDMWGNGDPKSTIASRLGVSESTIHTVLSRNDAPTSRRSTFTKAQRLKAVEMYSEGAKQREVANAVGASPSTVARWLKEAHDVAD